MTRIAAVLCLALLHGLAPQVQRFRTTVDAVRVDVLVVDGNRPVAGLVADDFELRDSGVVQSIESVAMDDVPLSVMFALDTSDSVKGSRLEQLRGAVTSTLPLLKEQDRAALLTFASVIRLVVDWSGNVAQIREAVSSVKAGGGTALWDATLAALTLRDATPGTRRLVLVFSDGDDRSSWLSRHAVVERAKRTDAVLYGVVITGPIGEPRLMGQSGIQLYPSEAPVWAAAPFLGGVAEVTGGVEYRIRNTGEVRGAFARILTEFRTRYVLSFTPQGVASTGWHPLEVKLKSKQGKITARRGYLR